MDEQSFDQTYDDKTDEKVNVVTEANTKTLTGCHCSRELLEYEKKSRVWKISWTYHYIQKY